MSDTPAYPEWQNKPVRLTKEEIDDPLAVITSFLEERSLPDHREVIWNILQAAVEIDSEDAAQWLRYIRDLELFIEATCVLCGNLAKAEPM